MLSTGLFLMLAVAAIEDFFFVSWEQLARGAPWRRAIRVLLLPGALTSLTTLVGFASLCTSELGIVRRFGLWGAVGAALEWVATFVVLPALLRVAPRFGSFTDRARSLSPRLAERLVSGALPRSVARAALLVLALGAWGALHLDFGDSPEAWFSRAHPFSETGRYAGATRGWVAQIYVVFPGDASPAEVAAWSRRIAALPGVAQVLDPGTVLASWTGGDRLAPFELASEIAPSGAGGSSAQAGALTGRAGRMRAAVFLSDVRLSTVIAVRDAVVRMFPEGDGFPAGDLVSYAEFSDVVPRTLLHSLATCLVLVGLLIWLLFRAVGLGGGLQAVLASAFGPAAALSATWAAGIQVSFVTAVFASVLVGLTGDNAVQFACAARSGSIRGAIARRGGAAALVTLVMALCALTFLGSAFVPPRTLGLLLAGGLVAAMVGDVWILRGLRDEPDEAARPAPAGQS
jgi:predicted RND superfamily exporter protein